jgi:hypothetical protein
MKSKFELGDFIIEYRHIPNGILYFLDKTITDVEEAIKESNKLKDKGYSDVLIKINKKNETGIRE